MDSGWDEGHADQFVADPLELRAYSSRLLGANPDLVLHGGGNTSVKLEAPNLYDEHESLVYVKGSGWDLASIAPAGFAPLRIDQVRRLVELESLSDPDMMRALRSASVDPAAPAPSVESITHALIPHRYVDHTHADAVVTITNTSDARRRLQDVYGQDVLVIPYTMPGFDLAKLIAELTSGVDWDALRGLILMKHGVFTFADDARESYEAMIDIVSRSEEAISGSAAKSVVAATSIGIDPLALAALRKSVSDVAGVAMVAVTDTSDEAAGFSTRFDAGLLAGSGCLTPDHVIHTKPWPAMVDGEPEAGVVSFKSGYETYFEQYASPGHTRLDSAPRWAVWTGRGLVGFGISASRAGMAVEIGAHTVRAAQIADDSGGWEPNSGQDLFDVEYWDFEQAKLRRQGQPPEFAGKIAIVSGAASGIGRACAEALISRGAVVAALDIAPLIEDAFNTSSSVGIICDVTSSEAVDAAVKATVLRFGGLDIVVTNAGTFPPGQAIEELDDETWRSTLDTNLTGHQRLLRAATPYLRLGVEPAVVVVASKNVPAPGPGAAAYSASKAGLTQLARVAALELGPQGVRVNVVHPNSVFDTGIWTTEVLENRARHYGITVEEYKRDNVLGVEVESVHVADMVCAMAGSLFSRTTGAQVPIDGGNERVI